MIRLFLDAGLATGTAVPLRPEQAHYLMTVMRQGEGAEVLLFNGRDGEWTARLERAGKRDWRAVVSAQTRAFAVGPDLDLIIAVVKRPRLETIVEKAAELGARRIRPVTSDRTNPTSVNLDRLSAIAVEASEQSGRLDAPQVLPVERLDALIAGWPDDRGLLFCDEAREAPAAREALSRKEPGPWAILIGPEGGFSPAERAAVCGLQSAVPVSLGPRILRADTAAISAMTLWQSVLGDWS